MSLADAPIDTNCQITTAGHATEASAKYAVAGVSSGRQARVLARYPMHTPRFVEVELDGQRLVTLPIDYAGEVVVEPLYAGGASLTTLAASARSE
jgi:hypothetical protein